MWRKARDITESWINENLLGDRLQDYNITNYDMFVYQRKTKMGGGILVYIKTELRPLVISNFNICEEVESLWVDIHPRINLNSKIRVGAFYRPPNQSRQTDLAMIEEIERGISKNTIILGDFNLPKLVKDSSSNTYETTLFKDNFDELFLTQHVFQPTRNDEILDLILTNNENLIGKVAYGETIGNSEHVIIRFNIKRKFKRACSRLNITPNFANGDYQAIRLFLRRIQWTNIFEGKTVSEMWNIFKKDIS